MKIRFNGSHKCQECNGRGTISYGERHGSDARDNCPCCKGRKIIPKFKEKNGI